MSTSKEIELWALQDSFSEVFSFLAKYKNFSESCPSFF
jgi:hypothetical protein